MAFLLKIFSGSERLKARQKSAALVNETFQAQLSDVQTKVEVENYELQMLVEMVYDSSYPESQKFLKQPSEDRLYAHKEIISSLLFGMAAQGLSVAPLILTHFQKHGCDGIADTLLTLLDLVRPLLDSRDVPSFTSDDILDAIDVQWHSSVRSSPAFASLRGSTTASPLQSPRVSFSNPGFSNLSPRQSFSNEDFSPVSDPFTTHADLDFSFSPPSEAVKAAAAHEAPRRSLSFQYPGSERLQPLVEHEEEIVRKDGEAVAPSGEFGKGLSIHIPRSATSFTAEDVESSHEKVDKSVGDVDAEVLCEGFSSPSSREHEVDVVVSSLPIDTQPHVEELEDAVLEEEHRESFRDFSTVAPFHSFVADADVEEFKGGQPQVPDEEPTLVVSHEQFDTSVGDGDAQVLCEGASVESEAVPSARDSGDLEASEKDNSPFKYQFHHGDSDQTSVEMSQVADNEEPRLESCHEQFNKNVTDGDAEVLCEGVSGGILESEAVPSSRDSSDHEASEQRISPFKDQVHNRNSDQTSVGMSQVADEQPESSHEKYDKTAGDVDAEVLREGVSGDILESEPVPSSRDLSDHEVSEMDITPFKDQLHVGYPDQTSVGMSQVAGDDEPRLGFSHEQFNMSVGDGDAQLLCGGVSGGILDSESAPSSCDSSKCEVSEGDITTFKDQILIEDSDQTSLGMSQVAEDEEPRLESTHEQFDKSVGDVDDSVLCEGFPEGESEAMPSSRDSSNHEVSEEDITPFKDQFHDEDSDQTSVGMSQVADEKPSLESSHEQFDKCVGNVDDKVLCEGFPGGIPESEAVPSSRDPSEHEVSEKEDITPVKDQFHGTGDSDQTSVEMSHVADDEEPRLESCHEQFNKIVGDNDAQVLCERVFEGILEGEPVPSSRYSSNHEVSEEEITPINDQFHVGDSDQTSVGISQVADEEQPSLESYHEHFDKFVGDGDAEVLCEGVSEGILEGEPVPSSRDSSNHEVSQEDITPIKDQFHVGDSDQTSVEMSQVAEEEARLEKCDKSVGDGDVEVLCEGASGGHADILEIESAVPSSCEKSIGAALPAKSQIHAEDSEQRFGDGQSVRRTQLDFSHDKSAHEVVFQDDTAAKDTLEESDQVPSCGLSNHEDVVTLPVKSQRHGEDSKPTVIPDTNVEVLTSFEISLISKAGMEEDVPIPQDAVTTQLKSEEFQESEGSFSESSNGRAPSILQEESQGTEMGSSPWSEKSTPIQGDTKDNVQNEMDNAAEEIFLVRNEAVETVGKDGAMEEVKGVEGDGEIMEEGALPKSAGEDVSMEEDRAKKDAEEDRAVEGKKEDGEGGSTESVEEDHVLMGGVEEGDDDEGVGEAEEPASVPRSCKTDSVSQISFSDHYGGAETTTSSSDEGMSSSTSDDDDEVMPGEKSNHQILPNNVGNPELQLHSPSYDLITFDLTKLLMLSTDENHQEIQGGVEMHESTSVTVAPAFELHSHADLVPDSGPTSLQHPMQHEFHDAEVSEGECHRRNDKLRVSRGDNEVTNSGEEQALITMDSAKTGSEDIELMVSTKSEDPGRDFLFFSSTIDEQDRISLPSDQAESFSPEFIQQSKEKEGGYGVEKEKYLVVHVDEGILASQGEERQEIKQVLEGVDYQDVHVDESSRHPFVDKEKDLVVMSPSQGDIKQVLNQSQESVKREEVVSKLSECGFKELEMKDMSTQADDETSGEVCKKINGISSMERDDKLQIENPQSLEKEKDVELERHSIRDSLICTPASNFDGSVRTHENGQRRRYNFIPTWCCSCCSKPSVL